MSSSSKSSSRSSNSIILTAEERDAKDLLAHFELACAIRRLHDARDFEAGNI